MAEKNGFQISPLAADLALSLGRVWAGKEAEHVSLRSKPEMR